jgi:hypothetical protein
MPGKGPQSDLSDKALYLRPYEYRSHLIHTIKNLGISISADAECPCSVARPFNKTCQLH